MSWPIQSVIPSKLVSKNESSGVSGDPDLQHPNYTVTITQQQDAVGGSGMVPRVVVGCMPETIELNQDVNWKSPWGAGIAGEGAISDVLAATTGNRLVAQVLTLKVWQGSGNDFDFRVQFQLRAWNDPEQDVMVPLRDLLRMSLPSLDSSGFLLSPGPIMTSESIQAGAQSAAASIGEAVSSILGKVQNVNSQPGEMKDSKSLLTKANEIRTNTVDALGKSGITKKAFLESMMKNIISIKIGSWFTMNNVLVQNVQYTLNTQTPYGPTGQPTSADVVVSFTPMFAITQEDIETILMRAPR